MAKIFTSAIYDGKTCLQVQIEVSEKNFATDGSSSTVVADYYLVSVAKPSGLTGDVTSDYGTGQTFSCSIGSISQTFSSNAFIIADAINKAGDKFKIGTLSTNIKRSGNLGAGSVKVACSCTLVWRSGYPTRAISGTYSCINTKHTITYDANGGENAPVKQTKYYGHILRLRNEIPTRAGYLFKGWSSRRNGSVEYTNGGQFGNDVDTTLYAVWKMVDVKIDFEPVDIRIPCTFKDGIGGFKYFYCDPTYSVKVKYAYSFPDTITSAYVNIEDTEYEMLYGETGEIEITMDKIIKAIQTYGSQNEVLFDMIFKFSINGDEVEIYTNLICPLVDFNFTNISMHHTYVDRKASNLLYITLVCVYPKSFNPDVRYVNSYPLVVYESGSGLKALTCVGRKEIGENAFLITYNLNTNGLPNPLKLRTIDKVLLYDEKFDSESTLSKDIFSKVLSVYYSSTNKDIIIYKDKTVKAREFVEMDYLKGFYKGGTVCMGEFIENEEMGNVCFDESTFNIKELIETR